MAIDDVQQRVIPRCCKMAGGIAHRELQLEESKSNAVVRAAAAEFVDLRKLMWEVNRASRIWRKI